MAEQAEVFEKIHQDYLDKVRSLDFTYKAEKLGINVRQGNIEILFYNKKFIISPEEIIDPNNNKPHHAVSVVLCQYLLLCPETIHPDTELVTYKDFKGSAPYVQGFKNTAEMPIARYFSGQMELLEKQCRALGGKPYSTDISCDLVFEIQALPKVPVYVFFNDKDEDFSAECSLLFQNSVQQYLDMECIAIIGNILSEWLKREAD